MGKNLPHTIRKQSAFLLWLLAELSERYRVLARQMPLARRTSAPTLATSHRILDSILGPRKSKIENRDDENRKSKIENRILDFGFWIFDFDVLMFKQ